MGLNTFYVIEDGQVIPTRTKSNFKTFAKRSDIKVYERERFAKTALTRMMKKNKKNKQDKQDKQNKRNGNPRVNIFIIENGIVVSKRTRNPEQYDCYFNTREAAEASKGIDYTLTKHSVNIVLDGLNNTIIPTDPRFNEMRKACIEEDVPTIRKLIALDRSIANDTDGLFTANKRGREIFIKGEKLPDKLAQKIGRLMKENKSQPADALVNFWNRLQKNPDKRVRANLYQFLSKVGCSFVTDGYILAYKYVNSDYSSCFNNKFNWAPGKRVRENRKKCNSDPKEACSSGLHAGTFGYTGYLGAIKLLVKIDPKDVVCVPNDYSFEKMRCCCIYSVCHAGSKPLTDELIESKDIKNWTGQKCAAYEKD